MEKGLPPNVRIISDSYAEKWPIAAQKFAVVEFGPVTETHMIYLPLSIELAKLSPEEQAEWLRDPENSFTVSGILATWGSLYANERDAMSIRLRSAVIQRVNDAVDRGEVAAYKRDPRTGRRTS